MTLAGIGDSSALVEIPYGGTIWASRREYRYSRGRARQWRRMRAMVKKADYYSDIFIKVDYYQDLNEARLEGWGSRNDWGPNLFDCGLRSRIQQ